MVLTYNAATIGAAAAPMSDEAEKPYWLYLLECEGGRYYAGIAIDVEKRYFQHVFGIGAKFTRAFQPLRVIAAREYESKGAALRAEIELKGLSRGEKLGFFTAGNPYQQAVVPLAPPRERER